MPKKSIYILLISIVGSLGYFLITYHDDSEPTTSVIEKIPEPDNIQEVSESSNSQEQDVVVDSQKDITEIPESKVEESEVQEPTHASPNSEKYWWQYPQNIREIPLSEVDYMTTVDKANKLPPEYSPNDLVRLTSENTNLRVKGEIYAREIILEDLQRLGEAAEADGLDLSIVSGYRSYQTQANTYQYWLDYNSGDRAATDKISARAGHSEHQLGTTIDFSTMAADDQLGAQFNNTPAATWLKSNAPKYNFQLSYPEGQEETTGYSYEGWHWRWMP